MGACYRTENGRLIVQGFFDLSQTKGAGEVGRSLSCASCGLYKNCLTYKIPPYGEGRKGILVVGEGPGEDEDRKGKPWQGKVGRILQRTLRRLGVDLFEDCVSTNAVNCHTYKNRDPSAYEIQCCHKQVVGPTIREWQPNLILLLGNPAVQSVIGDRWVNSLGGITRWRGWTIPDRDLNAWVCPTFHPSYVERYGDQEAWTVWEQDLERALGLAQEPLPAYNFERERVEIIHDADRLTQRLKEARQQDLIAIDYETTGLKPHMEGHRLVCAAIATGPNNVFAFPVPDKGKNRTFLKRLLADPDVSKIAHNMKFEENWSVECLGTPVANWYWDSMQVAHILDNRPKVTGLKFQVYANFGLIDYNSHVEPYLHGDGKNGANSLNRIDEFIQRYGWDELLVYCGLDSLLEYRLAQEQMQELK